jgi:DNA-binding NarL/FixJ family response regulator
MDKAPDSTRKISVLLADDHTMFRQGLATILASYGGVEVLGEVPNDAEALRLVGELCPDVVIMQVQMPFERAKESLARMRALPYPPKVIVVTMFEEPRYVRSLMELGASAYLVKTSSSEHLVAVVGMPPAMLEESRDGVEGVLSARELELLLLAARGLSNQQIAASTYLAEATVKRHLANVYKKMGVSSRGEAARKALLRDWITIEEITHSDPPLT